MCMEESSMITYQSRAPYIAGRGRCPYVQMLKSHDVVRLAVSICQRLGFAACDTTMIQRRMRKRLPTILEHDGCRLWIDRYYIALDDDSSAGFQYLYLTRWHAEETLRDHRTLLRLGQTPLLDSKTLELYGTALTRMRVERRGYEMYPLPA